MLARMTLLTGDDRRRRRARGVVVQPARQRKIIHVDMDAFYASVEQRDDPELRASLSPLADRASAVSSRRRAMKRENSACVGDAVRHRQTKCPDLIFVKPRFDAYKEVSRQIRVIFAEHTPIIEPLSLDEAYLDVTENLQGIVSATEIAEAIRVKIRMRPASQPPRASHTTSS